MGPTSGDDAAVAALARGFGTFPQPPRQRSRSRSGGRSGACVPAIQWTEPAPCYRDSVGVAGLRDGHGCLKLEAFPVEPFPVALTSVLGAARAWADRQRRRRAWLIRCGASEATRGHSPPGRRYFRQRGARANARSGVVIEQEASWEVAVTAASAVAAQTAPGRCNPARPGELGPPDYLSLSTVASEIGAPSWGSSCREARCQALRFRCQQAPTDVTAWLDFAEFQWSQEGEGLGAPTKQVREKQIAVLEAALQKQVGVPDLRLLRALELAEADPAAECSVSSLRESRRARLLGCGYAELSEELVWSFMEACILGEEEGKDSQRDGPVPEGAPPPETSPAPVEVVRRTAADVLGLLAARKALAGHDGKAVAALERAELASISCVAFAEAASGHGLKALELLRAVATLAVFFPASANSSDGSDLNQERLQHLWTAGCRLGSPGALKALQGLQMVQTAVPPALAPLSDFLDARGAEKSPAEGSADVGGAGNLRSGDLAALLRAGPGPMRSWCAAELRRSCASGGASGERAEAEPSFEELQPFIRGFRTDGARKEAVLRFVDALGAPTLARHPPASRYRRAFAETFAPLELRLPPSHEGQRGGSSSSTAPAQIPSSSLPPCEDRSGLLARSAMQSLSVWPKEASLHETLLESLLQMGAGTPGESKKLPRRALKASEDPRLYFAYAHGLWSRGDRDEARGIFLKLCAGAGDGNCDARVAMAWWFLEMRAEPASQTSATGMPPRAFRVVLALALSRFDAEVLNAEPLSARELGMLRLQALKRLEQELPSHSRSDAAGCRLLPSSYQAIVLALCALSALGSLRKSLDLFLREVPRVADGASADRLSFAPAPAPAGASAAAVREAAEEERCWAVAAGMLVQFLLGFPQAGQGLLLEAVRVGLRLSPGSPWMLRALVAVHLERGTVAALRRDLDSALALHRPLSLAVDGTRGSALGPLGALKVALEAELACGPRCSPARLAALCERATQGAVGASPFAGGALWSIYGAALLLREPGGSLKATKSRFDSEKVEAWRGADREQLWRTAVRAVRHHPLWKSLRLLQLAAWEIRSGDSPGDEEELVDLVEAIEAKEILMHGDPLEAIA
ncbi:unnamed protein product [Polarella glacialis]|uniref:Uncharacterized protein n=1 Tax=Polarella glacialis TaxID=89957 RepID=A0A813LE49_POLGL|nr:unnamed protein product [Polarella glacialis]